MMAAASEVSRRVGLLAGWGRFPLTVAQSLKQSGHEVYCLGIKDYAEETLAEHCARFDWVGLSRMGSAVRFFRRHGVQHATMAGKVHKVDLYKRGAFLRYIPDWRTLRAFWPLFVSRKKDRRDDTLLLTVVGLFAEAGITFLPATDFAPDLLVKAGQLTHRGPTPAQQADIEFGWKLAKEMGRLDVGQTVVVKDRAPLAIEAIEGTDECIKRAGSLCTAGGFTVVKVAKPQQDMRFDVPTVGLGTLETIHAAGGALLAVEADRTILLDQPAFIERANRLGLVVVAL